MNIKDKIKILADNIFSELVEIRRHIHKYPELSFSEIETAKYVKSKLKKYNINFDDSFGKNAVIGIIEGQTSGETVALRADMDALAIQEKNEVEYASQNHGVMHACGHDVHTASLLGTAIILNQIREYIKGRIILIFQPAEELDPGGAKVLIDKGLLERYKIDKILGQHVLPNLNTGMFGFTPGKSMAATNELYITFTGKGGHAAIPAQRSDSVLALTNFINEASKLPNKFSTKDAPVIVAFGKIIADGAINIVPDQSKAEGTMRTFDEGVRSKLKVEIERIANDTAKHFKCTAKVEIKEGYPHLFNNINLTDKAINIAKDFYSKQNITLAEKRMTGEDFAYFSQKIPGVYYRMGIRGNGKGTVNLHNANFDIDEKSLLYSSAMMAYLAIKISE